jgi:hypothetical protein
MIVQDNVPSDSWFAGKEHDNDGAADGVWLFGSPSDPGAGGTGIYFGKGPKTLFVVNVQQSAVTTMKPPGRSRQSSNKLIIQPHATG